VNSSRRTTRLRSKVDRPRPRGAGAVSESFLGAGPADALLGAARRLRLPIDPQAVLERFELHPDRGTLLALVDVAGTVGLEARAFRAELDDLARVTLPAIVHLQDPARGEGAFALLVERHDEDVVLENPARRQTHRLAQQEFRGAWTGVVVQLAARATAVSPPSRRFGPQRIGAAAAARLAVATGALAFAIAAAARDGWGALGTLALLFAGSVASAMLFFASRRSGVASATPVLARMLCREGTLTDCESVLHSRYARIGGIELASWGLAFFLASLGLAGLGTHAFDWLALALLAAAPISMVLIVLQIWPLRRICLLCMTAHAAILGGAALGLARVSTMEPAGLATIAAAHGLLLAAMLGLVVPYLELSIENRSHRARLRWIGSTPWGALAELAGRGPAPAEPLHSTIVLGRARTNFRLDVLVHPTCPGCPPVLRELEALVRRHVGAVHAALHLPTRDRARSEDRELCVALSCIGILAGAEQLVRVLEIVERDPWPRLDAARAGARSVVAEFLPPEVSLDEALAEARAAVAAADRASRRLGRGTPTVLLNGRLWDAPVDKLDLLLSRHPALLAEVLELEPFAAP
jgi:uncharacterized membrane protein